jgi:hypothetical protein
MNGGGQSNSLGTPESVVAFAAGLALMDLMLPLVFSPNGPPTFLGVLYLGFFVAQIGLHAALVVLKRGRVVLRISSVALLALLAIWYTHRHEPASERGLIIWLYAWLWLLVAVAMLVPIVAGFRLQRFTPLQMKELGGPAQWQFSLKGLVIFTTFVCILTAVGVPLVRTLDRVTVDLVALIFAALLCVVPILLVPAILIPRRSWPPLFLASLTIAVACGVQTAVIIQMLDPNWLRALLFVVPAVLQLAALLGVRRLGYRLWRLESRPRPVYEAGTPVDYEDGARPSCNRSKSFPRTV